MTLRKKRQSSVPCAWCGATGWAMHHSRNQIYCSTKCGGFGRAAKQSRGLAERFWAALIRKPSGCWEWPRANNDGYGRLRHMTKTIRAHRHAYILTHGEIADDILVCHRCDNPLCCNPAHLFLGSGRDNTQDMLRKGRGRIGERHPRAKITRSDVALIRAGNLSQRAAAKALGISKTQVGRIRRQESWV